MKKLLILLTACILTGCSSLRQVQVIERVSRDTLYLNHIQYDSIYVDNWQLTDRTKDTIYLEKSHIEYRYKLLRDTVYKVQIDTIPSISLSGFPPSENTVSSAPAVQTNSTRIKAAEISFFHNKCLFISSLHQIKMSYYLQSLTG